MFDLLLDGFAEVFQWYNLLALVVGVLVGTILGAIPGLTSTMAIALVIPFTYTLSPVTSIIMLLGAYKGGIYGGSIPAILLGTPGTPAAAATVQDGYALAKKGQAGKALRMVLLASVIGDTLSDVALVLVAAPLARVALLFGPAEFTMLMAFALTTVAVASGSSLLKGLIAAVVGMILALIGLDPMTGRPRMTFGVLELTNGLELIPLLIGLMALSEVFVQIEQRKTAAERTHLPKTDSLSDSRLSVFELLANMKHIFRSTVIGTIVGIIPGLGPTIGAYLSYNVARSTVKGKEREQFGQGSLAGIAAAEAGNNAVSGANLIPLLAFGVPGDILAAIIVGAFLLQGVTSGPRIFTESPDVIYGIYAGLLTANIVMLIVGFLTLRGFIRLAELRVSVLFPAVILFCVVGSYAVNQSLLDVYVMLIFGVIGYLMRKFDFPLPTLVIGFILFPEFERSFRQALVISGGSPAIFFSNPIVLIFWVLIAVSILIGVRPYLRAAFPHGRLGVEMEGRMG